MTNQLKISPDPLLNKFLNNVLSMCLFYTVLFGLLLAVRTIKEYVPS